MSYTMMHESTNIKSREQLRTEDFIDIIRVNNVMYIPE
jgi:hypothetical protein